MAHLHFLSASTMLLAALTVCGDSAPVAAQGYGFASNFMYRPAYPVPYNFYSYQYQTLSGYNSNGPYSFTRYSYNNSPVPSYGGYFNSGNNSYPNSSPGPGSMGGGYGTSDYSSEGVLDRQRNALKGAQSGAKWNAPAESGNRPDLDAWLSEQATRREAKNPAQPAIDLALVNPNDDQLLSGLTLNELAARISALEAKGKKAAPGLCSPELVEKIVFTGGPSSDVLNRMHAAKLDYPEILRAPAFNTLVDAFDKAYAPILVTLQAGKMVPPADIDRLLAVIEKAKPMTEPMLKEAPIKDASALLAFYASLESAAKYLKHPDSVGTLGGKWQSLGVNVSELGKHMQKYRVRFGRGAAGDEAAYGSLHRGLLSYYAGLLQAK